AAEDHAPNGTRLLRPDQRVGHGAADGPAAGAGPAPAGVHARDRAGRPGPVVLRLAREHRPLVHGQLVPPPDRDRGVQRGRDRPPAAGGPEVRRPLADRAGRPRLPDVRLPPVRRPGRRRPAAPRAGRDAQPPARRQPRRARPGDAPPDQRQVRVQAGRHVGHQPDHRHPPEGPGRLPGLHPPDDRAGPGAADPGPVRERHRPPGRRAVPRVHRDARLVRAAVPVGRVGRVRRGQQLHGRAELREGGDRPVVPRRPAEQGDLPGQGGREDQGAGAVRGADRHPVRDGGRAGRGAERPDLPGRRGRPPRHDQPAAGTAAAGAEPAADAAAAAADAAGAAAGAGAEVVVVARQV
ncbi:MAG: Protein containing transglutaminase-like domain, putative cysteine protease, partial [uncultured Phycisphaerae bacterium]